jgi:Transposase DDE domain
MMSPLLAKFAQRAPFAVQAKLVLDYLLPAAHVNRLFDEHRGTQYTKRLFFADVVNIMASVVLRFAPSVHASYQQLKPTLKASYQAVYDKLRHIALPLSESVVTFSFQRAHDILKAIGQGERSWLPGYKVRLLDGNLLSATESRLGVLRTDWSPGLPGRLLAIMEQQTRLVEHVVLAADAYVQERSLLDALRPLLKPKDLWLADRNFCTIDFLRAIQHRRGSFVIRQHGALEGRLVGERRYVGRIPTGKVYEQVLEVTKDGRTNTYRRITVDLHEPTRDGDTELHVLSNLPKRITAKRVAQLYGRRWGIENLYREMDDNLNAEPGSLGHPQAALFTFCMGLVASNATQVLLGVLRQKQGEVEVQKLSHYKIALEIVQIYGGLLLALEEELARLARLPLADWLALLLDIAARIDPQRYYKRPPSKKRPVRNKLATKKKKYRNGGHHSTARLLEKQRNKEQKNKANQAKRQTKQ